ncbi:hypothetical protein DXG01_016226 [Tephrocybe rancida]|nr:hypothetical protein DXG01_016226 [Tephrocybe rancida]
MSHRIRPQSAECQKADWPSHKARCKHNREVVARMKSLDEAAAKEGAAPAGSLSLKDASNLLKKWNQLFKPVLNIAVLNALGLQTTPEKLQTHFLTVVLKPGAGFSKANDDTIRHCFVLDEAFVGSFEDALAAAPEDVSLGPMVKSASEITAEIRARGGLGCGVVLICVPSLNLSHFSPFGFTEAMDTIRVDKDWIRSLKHFIDNGITV